MKILRINNSILFLKVRKDFVKCYFFYPISIFNWIYTSNTIELTDVTVKLVVEVYKDLQKDYDRKYNI